MSDLEADRAAGAKKVQDSSAVAQDFRTSEIGLHLLAHSTETVLIGKHDVIHKTGST